MPTYEYECRKCHHSFELFQSMSDAPAKICPECGGSVRRMIGGGAGIIFKGSGFYVTDSKKASSASTAPKSGASTSASPAAAPACATPSNPACESCAASSPKKESA